jgi:hypothetical protein
MWNMAALALLDRPPAHVLAIQLDEVEGAQVVRHQAADSRRMPLRDARFLQESSRKPLFVS